MIKLNEYFGGDVKSLGYEVKGDKATVGVMEDGDFRFGTTTKEILTVIEGELQVLLPGEKEYKKYTNGQSFEVPADISFHVRSVGQTSYLCQFR